MRRRSPQQLELDVEHLEPPRKLKSERPLATTRRVEGHAHASTGYQRAVTELLEMPGALLTRSHLRELGMERRAIDAVFRALPVVALPGYSRPMIRAEDYLELLAHHTFRDDRVRPTRAA